MISKLWITGIGWLVSKEQKKKKGLQQDQNFDFQGKMYIRPPLGFGNFYEAGW